MTEFNLSDKICGKAMTNTLVDPSWIYTSDVREAVRLLKEIDFANYVTNYGDDYDIEKLLKDIDEIFGSRLI